MAGKQSSVAAAICLLVNLGGALAADSAIVPAYTPVLGQKLNWRIEIEGWRKSLGNLDIKLGEEKSTLTQQQSILSRTLEGFTALWEFQPPGPEAHASFDEIYRGTLDVYGVTQLAIAVDAGGAPQRAYGEGIRARLEEMTRQLDENAVREAQMLQFALDSARVNPIFEVQSLAPVAILVGRPQRASAWEARRGAVTFQQQTEVVFGVQVSASIPVTVEEIDEAGRSVLVSWVWNPPLEAAPEAIRNQIDAMLKEARQSEGALPGPLRSYAVTASQHYEGRARISLDDGSTLFAEEIRTTRVGLESSVLAVRAIRQ